MMRPQLWIVAGPNGAGKTTLATRRIEGRLPVVNPDTIAMALPRIAGKLDERAAGVTALRERARMLAQKDSFAVETTLSGASTLRLMVAARARGHKTTLVFVGLRNAELALGRVLHRVRSGGHAVPISAVLRRYPASLANLPKALGLADRSFILDNSGERRRLPVVIEAERVRFAARRLPAWLTGTLPDLAAKQTS